MRCFLFILLFLLTPASAQAQNTAGAFRLSGAQDIALAFYKTGGKTPPYESWIRKSARYTTTAPYLRPRVLAAEKEALQKAYRDFNPQSDVLTLGTRISASVHLMQADEQTPWPRYELHFDLPVSSPPSFPYTYLDNKYVLIPSDPDSLLRQTISKDRYDYLARVLQNESAPLTLIFQMRPVRAEMENPVRDIDGEIMWPLITELAAISLWNEKGAQLWENTMVTGIGPASDELMNLKQNRGQNIPY